MPGRPHSPGEGKVMRVLRSHDYLPLAPEPDFRGLKRIMAMFITAIVVCAGICAVTIIRDARQHSHVQHAEVQVRCTCMGRCLRH